MSRLRAISLRFMGGLAFCAIPLLAHHSFSAEYDPARPITLKGVVTKVEWANPHTYFYIDVKDGSGKVSNWACETAGPNTLSRRGWNRNSIKVGDQVTVVGYRARDGAPVASAREVMMADGHQVFAGMPEDGGPRH